MEDMTEQGSAGNNGKLLNKVGVAREGKARKVGCETEQVKKTRYTREEYGETHPTTYLSRYLIPAINLPACPTKHPHLPLIRPLPQTLVDALHPN